MATVTHGVALALAVVSACKPVRRELVEMLDEAYAAPEGTLDAPEFTGADAGRPHLSVRLEPIADGFQQPTDIQPVPGEPNLLVIAEKGGTAEWIDRRGAARGPLLSVDVVTVSEQGLLGIAFHPKFADNGLVYLNYTPSGTKPEVTRIAEWKIEDLRGGKASPVRVLLDVEQPYQNHNAGQLAFGPDGMLYIGFGDGGFRADPHGHGQDATTMLGSMLRIDVDGRTGDKPYGVPTDNPYLGRPEVPPETWAIGLRNPWRYSFAPDGTLVIADVGQDAWEEVSIARAGDNLGWAVREGRMCFPPDTNCAAEGFREPIYVYGRDDGMSITGGYVYGSAAIPGLAGRYVFGDFVSGRLWAIPLPDGEPGTGQIAAATSLGKFPILASTFGQDDRGDVYVADFGGGVIYRLAAAPSSTSDPVAP